jgi:integral membrane sensor domain MASE1
MRQKTDFESLLSSHMTQKSLSVVISKQLYLIQLVCLSSIGIILCTYTTDNLFEALIGRTYGIQLLPEVAVISDKNSPSQQQQPFVNNFFCLSLGLITVFCLALILYAFNYEKQQQ